ncbi:MAG TPA: RsmB/NOP family class I SAM-dependent RNA methyltransferase [Devosiaceae bacterium]|nr:RsmB/NOP family class I SAM-dependent RNA methyltransferase [Devosiaceae bacterium]
MGLGKIADLSNPPGLAPRLAAAGRLSEVLSGAHFSPFTTYEIPDGRDRALANRLVTVALRRHGHLNLVISRLLDRGLPAKGGSFEAVLRLGLTQLLYLPELGAHSAIFLGVEAAKRDKRAGHLAKLLNAVLRRAQGEAELLRQVPVDRLFPEALRKRWTAAYGVEAISRFGEALLEGAPLDLVLKQSDPALIEALGAIPLAADTVRLESRDRPVEALPGYADGRWWVQDFAASLPARLIDLPAGARVLDLCAAPGGKTAQLITAGYSVTALDSDAERLKRLRANLERLGYAATVVEADAQTFAPDEKFDAVLLDAPCSATGTFRRHPEVVWQRDIGDIAGRMALQRRLLANAADCLKPGGVLVYCVCSLEPEEGEAQAQWAAEALPVLAPMPVAPEAFPALPVAVTAEGHLRTHPAMKVPEIASGTLDGFFVARFRRV